MQTHPQKLDMFLASYNVHGYHPQDVPLSDGWHLPLLQSNVQLLEDVPPGTQYIVVSRLPGGKEQFSVLRDNV